MVVSPFITGPSCKYLGRKGMFSLASETTSWGSIHLKVHPRVAFAGSLYLDCIDCGVTSLDFCFGFWGGTDVGYFQQTKNGGLFVRLNLGSFYYTTCFVDIHHYTSRGLHSCPFSWRLSLSLCFFRAQKNIWRVSMCMKENGWPSASRSKVAMEGLISSSADGHRVVIES